MLTYFQALILGLLQGATELFPVSSLGHTVILPQLLGWHIDQAADFFLIFVVATHLATSLVLLVFFAKDWLLIMRGVLRSLARRTIDPSDTYARLGWLIVIGTIPAGILGLLLEKKLKLLFAMPLYVSIFLIGNGLVLWAVEYIKGKQVRRSVFESNFESNADSDVSSDTAIARISWNASVKVGLAQSLALLPGFSRTGSTLGGGLLVGLSHRDAARYSFLLATPIIFAAGVLKLPELAFTDASAALGPIIVGSLASALTAYVSVRFLTKYFRTHDMRPFAIYCALIGAVSLLVSLA